MNGINRDLFTKKTDSMQVRVSKKIAEVIAKASGSADSADQYSRYWQQHNRVHNH